MKTLLLALLALALWVAVLDRGMDVWLDDAAARDAMDRCLFNGGTPAICTSMEVIP